MVQLVVGVMRPRQSRSLTSSVFFLDVRCALSVALQRTSLLTNRQGTPPGGRWRGGCSHHALFRAVALSCVPAGSGMWSAVHVKE